MLFTLCGSLFCFLWRINHDTQAEGKLRAKQPLVLSGGKQSNDLAEKNNAVILTVYCIDLWCYFLSVYGMVRQGFTYKERAAVSLFPVFTVTAKESKGIEANMRNMLTGTYWCR